MGRKKKQRIGQNTSINRSYETTLATVVCVALLFILLVPAFFGVYQVSEFLKMHLLTTVSIFIVLLVVRDKKVGFLETKLDYLLIAIVVLYVVSIFWSEYVKFALAEALKYINYFLVFWLISQFLKSHEIRMVCKILFFIGLVSAGLAFLGYFKVLDWEGLVRFGRLVGTLKYSNSFAAYVSAMIALGYYLFQKEEKKQSVYLLGTYFLTLALFGSQSRIMWLIFFPGILIFGLGYPENKKEMLVKIVAVTSLAFVTSLFIFGQYPLYLKLAVLIVGGIFSYGIQWAFRKIAGGINKKVLLPLALIIVALFCLLTYNLLDLVDAGRIINRFKSIDLQAGSAQARLVFYQDAFEIMKQSNFLGGGGGAWNVHFPLVRSHYYFTSEAHSHLWKTGTEIGVLGMGLFLGVFLLVVYYMFKNRRDPEAWSLAIAFLFIYLHSLLDLDLSLGFMALVAWSLLGLFNHKIKNAGGNLKQLKIPKLAVIGFLSLYFLVLLPISISVSYSSNLGAKDTYDNVVAKLEKAIMLYPLDAQNYATLGAAHFQAFQQTQEQKYLDLALEMSEKAISREYNNYNWFLLKAEFLLAKGQLEDTVALLQEGRPYLFKFENQVYADTANLFKRVALEAEEDNNETLAKQALEEIITLWERAQAEVASVEPRFLNSWAEKENILQYDPFLIEVIYAYDNLDEQTKAKELAQELSEETIAENEWLNNIL